jgi:hypothetical protein
MRYGAVGAAGAPDPLIGGPRGPDAATCCARADEEKAVAVLSDGH